MSDTTIETAQRAEAMLTDPAHTAEVDSILRRTEEGYRAASAQGSIEFTRTTDDTIEVMATAGDHPLSNDRTDQRTTVGDETDDPWARLGDHATPLAMESVAQYFDSVHAPDLVVLHAPTHRFHDNVGEHGSSTNTSVPSTSPRPLPRSSAAN